MLVFFVGQGKNKNFLKEVKFVAPYKQHLIFSCVATMPVRIILNFFFQKSEVSKKRKKSRKSVIP